MVYIVGALPSQERRWQRGARFALPSIIAATFASLVVGMFDGARNTYTVMQALAATGYIAIYAVPVGIAMALLGRAVARSWRRRDLFGRFVEDTGGAPRLAAMASYAVVALWLFSGVALNALRVLIYSTPAKSVVMLGATAAVIVTAAALIVLSKPLVDVGSRWLGWIDRRIYARWSRSAFAPKLVVAGTLVALSLLVVGAWFVSLSYRLEPVDLSQYAYVAAFFALVFAVQLLWLRLLSPRTVLAAAVAAVLVVTSGACVGTGYYVRHRRPYAMLEVWANTVLAGTAVDRLFNIESMRRDLRLPGMKPKALAHATHSNVVLITIDNARADRMGLYNSAAKQPTMHRLRREGIVFDWAFAAGTVTRRSLPPILLGVNANRARGRVTGQALRLDPRHILLAERFRAAGYETAGFLSAPMLFSPKYNLGLTRGLDHLVVAGGSEEQNGEWLVRQARAWLRARRARKPKKKLFLWVHFSDLSHWDSTYTSHHFGRNKRTRYDMACEDVDKYLGFLLVDVWNTQTKHNTVLAIIGDHGAALDEDTQTWSTGPLGTGRLRVPLFIAGAGRRGRRVQRPVSTFALAPTLLELAGFEPPGMPHMDGKSFAAAVRSKKFGRAHNGEAYSAIVEDRSVPAGMRALMRGGFKLIEHDDGQADEMYSYRGDPRELRNLVDKQKRIYRQMKARMDEFERIDRISPF